jgi:para-nitrobenzyl esterase
MRNRSAALALVLSTLALTPVAAGATSPAAATHDPAVVRTDAGLVRGTVADGLGRFQGIPFAAPPVGALRWQAPRPVRPWHGVYDATAPRSQCAQLAPAYGGATTYGEDCLYLNVTTPSTRGSRPVMVWVHGGSNLTGSGAGYDAAKLAGLGDVVVVTVNYRLGVLGWLGTGNHGLLDQQAALRWVRHNARSFGGNPHNVTLFGESAGAANTCANLASPGATRLFHKAIPQSYSCAAPARTTASAAAQAEALMTALGCADLACLRQVPVKTLLERFAAMGHAAGPVAGTRELPEQPSAAIAAGRFHRMPVLHGNTLDEMRLFVGLSHPAELTAAQYTAIVTAMFPDRAAEVLLRYPPGASPRLALAAIQSDHGTALSTCTHLAAYDLFAAAGVPVYAYQFADRGAPPLIDLPGFDEGAEHATELTYLWRDLLGPLTAAQERLSRTMVGYWTSFARTGHPRAQHAPRWPRYRDADDVLNLAPGAVAPVDVAARAHCDFWAGGAQRNMTR